MAADGDSSRQLPMDPAYKPKSRILCGQNSVTDDPLGVTQIMVLYCGGTIGSKRHGGVYSPEPNYLIPELRKLPMCHDTSYKLAGSPDDVDSPLVMPLMSDQRRIVYSVIEYDPLLDSSNMTVDDYAQVAVDIKKYYDLYDGFVILHGTDTMAYTASALSFMLENLGKPVILTGSQIPLFEIRSDGRDNFLGALIIAANYHIPEVMLYFHNTLLRGNRSTKADSGAMDAFKSHNMSPLGVTEINIKINWSLVYRHAGIHKFQVHTNMCREVGLLRLFPSITLATVQQFLQPPTCGVVLQSYGAGNGPSSRVDLMAALREASDRGVLIINTTQCARGTVSATYAAGKALLDCGVIPGSDMTAEAALMKLSYVLGKEDWSLEKKRKIMSTNLRGEMTLARETEPALLELGIVRKMAATMKISSESELKLLRDTIFPSLLCAAARQGDVDVLEELRQAGADFSMDDHDGRTALHIATCEGHEAAVVYLLESGASVHARDRYGHSPLDDAVFFKHLVIIGLLRRAGAHLRLPPAKLGMMLCNSATLEDASFMKAWHMAGAQLSQGDYDKRTPLHLAAAVGNEEIIDYLLSMGVDKLAKDVFGRIPLDEAVINGHTNIAKILRTNSNS